MQKTLEKNRNNWTFIRVSHLEQTFNMMTVLIAVCSAVTSKLADDPASHQVSIRLYKKNKIWAENSPV